MVGTVILFGGNPHLPSSFEGTLKVPASDSWANSGQLWVLGITQPRLTPSYTVVLWVGILGYLRLCWAQYGVLGSQLGFPTSKECALTHMLFFCPLGIIIILCLSSSKAETGSIWQFKYILSPFFLQGLF